MQSLYSHIIKLINYSAFSNLLQSPILKKPSTQCRHTHQNLWLLQYARYLQKGPTTKKHLYNQQLYKLLKSASGHWLYCDCCLPHPTDALLLTSQRLPSSQRRWRQWWPSRVSVAVSMASITLFWLSPDLCCFRFSQMMGVPCRSLVPFSYTRIISYKPPNNSLSPNLYQTPKPHWQLWWQ